MMVLLLLIPSAEASAPVTTSPGGVEPLGSPPGAQSFDFEFSGLYTWGEVITSLCSGGWCRVQLPRDFYSMQVPLSVYENSFDNAFKALSMQALADGYVLKKSGKKKPFIVTAELDQEKMASYISCLDTLVKSVPAKDLSKYKYVDSVKCVTYIHVRDSLFLLRDKVDASSSRYRVSFYVVSASYVQSLGVDWTSIWAQGDLFNIPELITDWTFKAVADDDSTAEFRSLEIDIDSLASIHWGSQRKEEKSTIVYDNGVSKTDFEYRDFGLTLDLKRSKKSGISVEYKLAQRDENNSVLRGRFGGGGSDSVVTYGVYDSFQKSNVGIPFFSSLPLIGYIFGHEVLDKIKSFFVIRVYRVSFERRSISLLDSLRVLDVVDFHDTLKIDSIKENK